MEVSATYKYARISPQKCRLVADNVRGQSVPKALLDLQFCRLAGAEVINKVLRSAVANATSRYNVDTEQLWVKTISVNKSLVLKRWLPRAKGRATPKLKRQCHVHLTVSDNR